MEKVPVSQLSLDDVRIRTKTDTVSMNPHSKTKH